MKHLLVLFALLAAMAAPAQKKYKDLWKQVETYQKKDLPQSAIKKCEEIYRLAERNGDFSTQLRAFLTRMENRQQIHPDSLYPDLRILHQWAEKTDDAVQSVVLSQACLAALHRYVQQNYYEILQRSATEDVVEDPIEKENALLQAGGKDSAAVARRRSAANGNRMYVSRYEQPFLKETSLKKWSKDDFRKQYLYLIEESMKYPHILAKVSADDYAELVEKGAASRYFTHNLLHLVALNNLHKITYLRNTGLIGRKDYATYPGRVFRTLLDYYSKDGNRSGLFLTRYIWTVDLHNCGISTQEAYEGQLRDMMKKFEDLDVSAEARLQLIDYLIGRQKNEEALQLCEESIQKYLHYDRVNLFKERRNQILQGEISVQFPEVVYAREKIRLHISYKNTDRVTLKFYPLNYTTLEKTSRAESYGKNFIKKYASAPITQEFKLSPSSWQRKDTTIDISAPGPGLYLARTVSPKMREDSGFDLLHVSNLMLLTLKGPKEELDLVVVDRCTGKPLPGVNIAVLQANAPDKRITTLQTGKDGRVSYTNPDYNRVLFYPYTDADRCAPTLHWWRSPENRNAGKTETESISLLTDRRLYRPGQTVYVKGIARKILGDSTWVCPNTLYTLTLHDANRKEISRAEVRSNEFGSFSHAFSLPGGSLNGSFSIRCNTARSNIQVEEYKRPAFEVLLDTLPTAPQFGDSVCLSGSAMTLNGLPLQGDTVRYHIKRMRIFPLNRWHSFPGYEWSREEEIARDTTVTDEKGRFVLSFRTLRPEGIYAQYPHAFRYEVQVDVTDAAGETHSTQQIMKIGTPNLLLQFSGGRHVLTDSLNKVIIYARDLNERKQATEVQISLTNLKSQRVVLTDSYPANKPLPPYAWKNIPAGKYLLRMEAADERGRISRDSTTLFLFSKHDTKAPCDTICWIARNTNAGNQQYKEVYIASSADSIHLFYDLYSTERGHIESREILFSDSLLKFPLRYRPEYGEGARLLLSFVKKGISYSCDLTVEKPQPDKALKLKWTTFRDRLEAGQKEEWRLSITRPDGTPANAELAVSLYDAALDKIFPHSFSLHNYYFRNIPWAFWSSQPKNHIYLGGFEELKHYTYPEFTYDRWRFSPVYGYLYPKAFAELTVASTGQALQGRIAGLNMARSKQAENAVHAADMADVKEVVVQSKLSAAPAESTMSEESLTAENENETEVRIAGLGEEIDLSAIRSDFRESAFFYPALRTDSAGNVSIAFTLPESLTRWHLVGAAHTADFHTGILDEQITAAKSFMLSSHLPRYLRRGDHTTVTARLRNLSEETVKGQIILELFDPATMRVVARKKQSFRLATDSTKAYTFEIDTPDNLQTVGIRMVADGGQFSDGEQYQLAVLPASAHLVQAVPLTLRQAGEKEYDLSELFNYNSPTATQKQYTVELYANPAWSAVMALPLLHKPQTDNALDFAIAYYANTLSTWLVDQSPELRLALQLWQSTGTAQKSKLTRNEELKTLLLEETPWVEEAGQESARIAALGQLADRNTMEARKTEMIRKLQDMQLPNGSFPWFHGMTSSPYITAQVAEILGRLYALTGTKPEGTSLYVLQYACQYIYREKGKEFANLTDKQKKEYSLSSADLQYLYLCTLAPIQPEGSAAQAKAFYTKLLPAATPSFDLFGKARAIAVLAKSGLHQAARECYRSIQEYSTSTEELGSFFAGNNARGYLPESLLATLIEASRLMGDTTLTADMQFHLLRHKQTRMWQSPLANANAVYALLKDAGSLAAGQAACSLTIGKQTLSTQAQAGTPEAVMGYAKASFPAEEVKKPKALFRKTGHGPAWGAVYGQCEEKYDRIKEQGTRVKIEKELFVLRSQGGKTVWTKLTPQTILQKGDRILTRLTVENDRDLDFVSIKDDRAACLEPTNPLSGYRNGAYQSEKDASTTLFIDRLPRGTHTFELQSTATRAGTYTSGIARLQCAYSTEFTGHSASQNLRIP